MPKRRAKRVAPEDVFVDALEHTEPEFLVCRELRHVWRPSTPFRLVDASLEDGRQPRGGHTEYAERRLTCSRCGTERSDAYAISRRRGHTALTKIGSSYNQPEGYAITGIGSTASMRDILLGVAFENQLGKVG